VPSHNDPEPDVRRSGAPVWLIATIVVAVLVVVALHLAGIVGPG
jgi:hypothetical protein